MQAIFAEMLLNSFNSGAGAIVSPINIYFSNSLLHANNISWIVIIYKANSSIPILNV